MRTFKLSVPILAIVMITLLSLGVLGCDDEPAGGAAVGGSAAQSQPDSGSTAASGLSQEDVDFLSGLLAQDSGLWRLSPEMIRSLQGETLHFQDPEGDVYDYETGADVFDHPELDLTDFEISYDEDSMQIEIRVTCVEEPGRDEFVSGFVALTDEPRSERPLGDPFAPLSSYLYFWRMNSDSYVALLEQTSDGTVVADESAKIEIVGPSFRVQYKEEYFLGTLEPGESIIEVVTTDGLGSCDFLDQSTLMAIP